MKEVRFKFDFISSLFSRHVSFQNKGAVFFVTTLPCVYIMRSYKGIFTQL